MPIRGLHTSVLYDASTTSKVGLCLLLQIGTYNASPTSTTRFEQIPQISLEQNHKL